MSITRILRRKKQNKQSKHCVCCGTTDQYLNDIAITMNFHFGNVPVEDCTCEKCVDFKMKFCAGENRKGIECGMCIENKVERQQ